MLARKEAELVLEYTGARFSKVGRFLGFKSSTATMRSAHTNTQVAHIEDDVHAALNLALFHLERGGTLRITFEVERPA